MKRQVFQNGEMISEVDIDVSEEELSRQKPETEKLRAEFNQKLEERVNQIAEAVESGARGQELADKMRNK